jgi:catechol 2,3-dioxygenase-like lactoylglutathione lyase family enzyme
MSMPPGIDGLLESSLYVVDVAASARFYREVMGFHTISDFGKRGCAMRAGPKQVLLLFEKGGSLAIQSPHDGTGELHVAFAISLAELPQWESWLAENSLEIEEKRTWERGGISIYFRDPDRHLLELATPGVWSVY